MTTLRLGTRGSRMALVQSSKVKELLEAAHSGLAVELVQIATRGDQDQSSTLAAGDGSGWFTSAIQEAILRGDVDFGVHSYKDLPTSRPPGLLIAAVPQREDPRDALVARGGRGLRRLPAGAVIGTGSPRREAQLRAIRGDIDVRPIRGNVDTRIAKVDAGEYDAIVVALAGLRRLGAEGRATEVFGLEEILPAPAQGALALECREDDGRTTALLRAVDHAATRQAVIAERSFLARLEGGCAFPAAAYAEHFGTTLKLSAMVAVEGLVIRAKTAGAPDTAAGLGRELADELLARGGSARG